MVLFCLLFACCLVFCCCGLIVVCIGCVLSVRWLFCCCNLIAACCLFAGYYLDLPVFDVVVFCGCFGG